MWKEIDVEIEIDKSVASWREGSLHCITVIIRWMPIHVAISIVHQLGLPLYCRPTRQHHSQVTPPFNAKWRENPNLPCLTRLWPPFSQGKEYQSIRPGFCDADRTENGNRDAKTAEFYDLPTNFRLKYQAKCPLPDFCSQYCPIQQSCK